MTTNPSQPILTSAQSGYNQIKTYFIQTSDGGSPIVNYLYSLSGSSFVGFSPPQTTSPLLFSNLTTNTGYDIIIVAQNGTYNIEFQGNALYFSDLRLEHIHICCNKSDVQCQHYDSRYDNLLPHLYIYIWIFLFRFTVYGSFERHGSLHILSPRQQPF